MCLVVLFPLGAIRRQLVLQGATSQWSYSRSCTANNELVYLKYGYLNVNKVLTRKGRWSDTSADVTTPNALWRELNGVKAQLGNRLFSEWMRT